MDTKDFLNRTIPECESTNDLAKKLGDEGYPHGSWVSAVRQTKGRGRQGRDWVSLEGNLFLSLLLRFQPPYPVTWIPLLVGYGVILALDDFGIKRISLKWPNDLFVTETRKKVGGILCEGVVQGAEQYIVAGIGLNCAVVPSFDPSFDSHSGVQAEALGVEADRIRDYVIEKVLHVLAHPPGVQEFTSRLLIQPGETFEYAADVHSAEYQKAKFIRVGDSGELIAEVDDGLKAAIKTWWSGEVRLKV